MNFYERIRQDCIYSQLNYLTSIDSQVDHEQITNHFSYKKTKIKNARNKNLTLFENGIELANFSENKQLSYRDAKNTLLDVYPELKIKVSETLVKNFNIPKEHDIFIFNSYIRDLSRKNYSGSEKDNTSRPQANYVHIDYNDDRVKNIKRGNDHLLDMMSLSGREKFLKNLSEKKNHIFLNIWQALGVITTNNLGFIDNSTINPCNIKKISIKKNGSISLVSTIIYEEHTEAFYFPLMSNNELVMFVQHSSCKDIPVVLHSAFDIDDFVYAVDFNRSSIEYRVCVLF